LTKAFDTDRDSIPPAKNVVYDTTKMRTHME